MWLEGRPRSDATDLLDTRFHLGGALGGNLERTTGNILGGNAPSRRPC